LNYSAESELLDIVEGILQLDDAMRFAAIIDLEGNILEAIMKEKKTSLESQKMQEKFCKDALRQELCEKFMMIHWEELGMLIQKEKM